ncbi:uncharacterized protein [Triticum aestivum]|uniref:uncharacterized protein n=1 Tax=Triticum aestivum TaxID=4565 RepID=UPI001D02DBC7|nr:uncharacterized protein LOC123119968 [Triticum aestivum]
MEAMGAGGAWAKGRPVVGCWAGRGSTGPVEDRGACSGCSSAAPEWARARTHAASCGSSACPTSPPATLSAASSPPKAPLQAAAVFGNCHVMDRGGERRIIMVGQQILGSTLMLNQRLKTRSNKEWIQLAV